MMNLSYIVELLMEKQDNLKEIMVIPNEKLEFFDKFISDNNLSSLSGILDVDIMDMMVAYLLTISDKLNPSQLKTILKNVCVKVSSDDIEELEDEELSFFGVLKKIKEMVFDYDNNKKLLFSCYGEEFERVKAMADIISELKSDYDLYKEDLDEFINDDTMIDRVSSKKRKQLVYEELREKYNIDMLISDLSVIEKCYNKLRNDDKIFRKNMRKTIVNYDNLIRLLSILSIDKVLNINTFNAIVNLFEDDEILKLFFEELDFVLEQKFIELNDEYNKLSINREVNIQVIFDKYSIVFNKLDTDIKNKIFKLSDQEIELFLTNIKNLRVVDFETIKFILKYSNNTIIESIISMIKNGFLTFNFVLNNREILSDSQYTKIINKLNIFKKYNVNPLLFVSYLDVYLVDCDLLENNFSILRQYNLLNQISKLNEFKFMINTDLELKIDLLLELGFENILEENLNLLSTSVAEIKKLYVLKGVGALPSDIDDIYNILNNKDFLSYVDDSYLFNIVDYRVDTKLFDSNIKTFEEYLVNDNSSRVIEFNGIYLSKNRIMRNIIKLNNVDISNDEKLIYSFIYGAILSEEEYDVIFGNKDKISKKLSI